MFRTARPAAGLLVAACLAVGPATGSGPGGDRVVEIVEAERIEPDGRFEAFPRWTASGRPSVALALSGGFARGVSHLGVLAAMHEDGVEFDAIAGTSMGAILGAFLCGGYRPDEIEGILTGRDWNAIISGLDVPRRVLSESEDIRRTSPLLRLALRRGARLRVGALVESRLLERELYRYLLRAQLESGGDFDRLRCRFRAVSTDILTGTAVTPDTGDLAALVRGSAAVPGVFPPVPFGEALLVDGGLVENVPVETARGLGADVVVALDATEGIQPTKTIRGTLSSLNRMVSVLMAAQGDLSLSRADLVIRPDVADLPVADLRGNVDALVRAGREAYAGLRDELWALLESRARSVQEIDYDAIEVVGTDWVSSDEMARRLGGSSGTVTRFRIEAELARALNLGPFENARAETTDGPAGRRLRFVFRENALLERLVRKGDRSVSLEDLGATIPFGKPFSVEEALRIAARAREHQIDRGSVLVKLEEAQWDAASGTVTVQVEDLPVGRIVTEVQGEIRLEQTQRFFRDLQGQSFAYDRLADRLDEMSARGAILDWAIHPERSREGVDLHLILRGDDYFEVSGSAAWRDTHGAAGYLRAAKSNLTGRGDFVDVILAGARETGSVWTRYRTEYGAGFQNVGAEVGARFFNDEFPFVNEQQRLVEKDEEGIRGFGAHASLIRRLRWGGVVQGGLRYEREQLDATDLHAAETRSRTSLQVDLELNRHDRLLFPTRGGFLKASVGRSVAGSDLWRFELNADLAASVGQASRQTVTGRIGLGLSDGADRRTHWFDPGGYRDLYGFIPYGAAAPQYVHAGVTWRLAWFDLGAARVYLEAGLDGLRTSITRSELGHGDGALGVGASLTVYTRLLGPITLGVARNDARADTLFLTAGYSFVRRVGS